MEHKHHYTGLSDAQVIESREKHGENILTTPKKESLWKEFFGKFTDPIIVILLVALVLSIGVSIYEFYTGHATGGIFFEPAGIAIAILLATVVGFFFELSANKKFEVLNKVNDDTFVKVIRNGNICQVAKKEVVVGDVVILETGEEVPADGKLLEAVSLQINESTLTGEPVIKKTVNPTDFDKDSTYPSNHALKGTTIADGHGIMEVLKVGDATEYGKVYEGSQIDNSVETPLNKQLDKLADLITKASYAIAILIVIGRVIVYFHGLNTSFEWIGFGGYLLNTIMIAVTVIVVAVPEGLPMSVTLSLALSMKRMLSTNNLVRKMHACETMGATTVICTDKTGTLTQNQMKIYQTNFYGLKNQKLANDEISNIIKESIAVNSTAYLDFSDAAKIKALGNPTEGALLLWLYEYQTNYLPLREEAEIVKQLTFSTERKYMATIVQSPLLNKKVLYVKGAPEIVLSLCKNVLVDGNLVGKETYEPTVQAQLLQYQNQAMRTLGFAYQIIDNDDNYIKEGRLAETINLTCLGIVAISDPVRSEVPDAVKNCLDAGIAVKIVTGDTPGTAKEIGRQIGLWSADEPDTHHLTGTEFASMQDKELLERVVDLKILSRARPMDKQRLVQLLQAKDMVVAVTGDGTNDAPALNAAQVGLSMGDGTSVAKEASDITILDNSFSSISRAVMWGRSLYQNIQRFILFQMTINVAACLIVLIGAFLGTESPLTVTQMLWVNLIMDTFAALALASLPPNEKVMKDKPRKTTDHIISKAMTKNILSVGLFFVVLLFGLVQYFKHADITSLSQFNLIDFGCSFFDFSSGNGLTPYELSLFFTIFVMLQFWNMFNAKAFMTGKSAFRSLRNSSGFLSIAAVILIGQWVITTIGGEMFNVVALKLPDWAIIIGATSLVLWIGELIRLVKKNKSSVFLLTFVS
ncbi:MAG: Calcium-transporting ATPase 1 [Candidatus Ordinivivax streblomastigis]|uniref:P-type Ca(2+) transporter n=1 Tax=Candidatus Ordinivivax streblomastigis TaxID=2540710 RepID=A0A5M8NUZ5_9BACT|nr:MAG: Calcium-transporting ATPase 1 [Candidatus Ordinivivax streblomastigis]